LTLMQILGFLEFLDMTRCGIFHLSIGNR
jgi:hypothetical protein